MTTTSTTKVKPGDFFNPTLDWIPEEGEKRRARLIRWSTCDYGKGPVSVCLAHLDDNESMDYRLPNHFNLTKILETLEMGTSVELEYLGCHGAEVNGKRMALWRAKVLAVPGDDK